MVAPNITDPFFKQLYFRLIEEVDKRAHVLIDGGAFSFSEKGTIDIDATALKYQKDVSYIEALQQVIQLGLQIDHERYDGKRGTDNDGD
jgi:hypothetical protein